MSDVSKPECEQPDESTKSGSSLLGAAAVSSSEAKSRILQKLQEAAKNSKEKCEVFLKMGGASAKD
jgi:hypothetical protein